MAAAESRRPGNTCTSSWLGRKPSRIWASMGVPRATRADSRLASSGTGESRLRSTISCRTPRSFSSVDAAASAGAADCQAGQLGSYKTMKDPVSS
eukprot:scaffold118397_cov28-Tisochrysis_lutea.AAC.1